MINEPSWTDDRIEFNCEECGVPIVPGKEFSCRCEKYGYPGHEDSAWCSDDCMSEAHPEP